MGDNLDRFSSPSRIQKSNAVSTRSPFVIKDIKQAALDDGMNAWEIMEDAAKEWLARRKKTKRKA